MTVIIANSSKVDYVSITDDLFIHKYNIVFITKKESLRFDILQEIHPSIIFFPHWSYIIPEEIYENFRCIIFHMTDLPFGRGGSPLQNLIKRKIKQTKISAIQCVKELDAGPVFLKEDLDLSGSAQEIYIRASRIIIEMIKKIIESNIEPLEQTGDIVRFQRQKPHQSEMRCLENIEDVFDHIRMLDADGYPKAFIKHSGFCFEFSGAELDSDDHLFSRVKISKLSHD
jgi:methionyl-tRNA formyltransferase